MKKIKLIKNAFIAVLLVSLSACSSDDNVGAESNNANMSANKSSLVSIHRLYNPATGKHYYTTLTSGAPYAAYPVYEGGMGKVLSEFDMSVYNTPIYVCSNPSNADRILTVSVSEYNNLLNSGWANEGIMGYTGNPFPAPMVSTPIYRYFNPSKHTHFYTSNFGELGTGGGGYGYEGVAFNLTN